jgi:hypothetical protein
LNQEIGQIKEIIDKSTNKNVLISMLMHDFNSEGGSSRSVKEGPKGEQESWKYDSESSRKQRRQIQNIFLSKGMNQQGSSDSSNGEAVRNSLSFGLTQRKTDSFRGSGLGGKEDHINKDSPENKIPQMQKKSENKNHRSQGDPNLSSRDSDQVLIRTESHYVQKFGSGIYQEPSGVQTRIKQNENSSRNRIDRITEESESKDIQTFSRNLEDLESMQRNHQEGSGLNPSQKNRPLRRLHTNSKPESSETGEARRRKHQRQKTSDSIKKYLNFYDYDSEMEEQNSFSNGVNRSVPKIETHTLEYLENYEATDDQTSPTETDNKVPSKKITTNSNDHQQPEQDLSGSKSVGNLPRRETPEYLPKYRTFNDNFEDQMEETPLETKENLGDFVNVNKHGVQNSKLDNEQKFIEIRDMILMNSARSYSRDQKDAKEEDSEVNGRLLREYLSIRGFNKLGIPTMSIDQKQDNINFLESKNRKISKMSLNDRKPQFELAPMTFTRTRTEPINRIKSLDDNEKENPNKGGSQGASRLNLSRQTLDISEKKQDSKIKNTFFRDSETNTNDRNIMSNSDNSYNIETEFCGKSEFIISHQKPKEGSKLETGLTLESQESEVIKGSGSLNNMDNSHIINDQIRDIKVNESSQMTEENFRMHTRKSPSEPQSQEASNIFVNNQIHHHLISTIKGKGRCF